MKVLGIKLTASEIFYKNGKMKIRPSVVAWALVNESEYMENKINIPEHEVIETAREKIGHYLKTIREGKNISIETMCEQTGLSKSDYLGIESGGEYTIDTFLKICRSLDCYLFLESRDGKHLDGADMKSKMLK